MCRPFEGVEHGPHGWQVGNCATGNGPYLTHGLFTLGSPRHHTRVQGCSEGEQGDKGHAQAGSNEPLGGRVLVGL